MAKTTVSLTLDSEIKDKALNILRRRHESLSGFVNKQLIKMVEKDGKETK